MALTMFGKEITASKEGKHVAVMLYSASKGMHSEMACAYWAFRRAFGKTWGLGQRS